MAKRYYSWEKPEKRARRYTLLIWLVGVPGAVALVAALGALIAYEWVRHQYGEKAKEFDLAELSQMEAASIIYDRQGRQMGQIFIENRLPIPASQMPKQLVDAVIAAEDNRFYQHDGVDYWGIIRAAIANYRKGRITQGASTVTQQLARNSYDLKERTYKRKLLEMFLAQRIERSLPKDKIMELYLNRVYFGSGLYGVEAAARGYFGVPARDLSVGQAAMLAGLLKSPNGLSPWNNPEGAKASRDFVLGRMREMRLITKQEYQEAVRQSLIVRRRSNPFKISYALDYVRQQAIQALGFDRAMNGGYRIYTTIDQDIQRAAERSLRANLDQVEKNRDFQHETFDVFSKKFAELEAKTTPGLPVQNAPIPEYLQGAVLAVENETGAIVTLVGGRDFKHSEYNRALQARRPVGTAFAPITFAAAFEKGHFPGEIVQDAALDNHYVMVGGETGILGEWGVERPDNAYEGGITARDALVKGKNAATVRMGFQIGLDALRSFAKNAGISSPLRDFANSYLGSSEITLEELTMAYTAFANGGKRPDHFHIISRIEDASGRKVYEYRSNPRTVMKPESAYQVHSVLQDALELGTGSVAYTELGLDLRPLAGKTGTAYGFSDTYFVGYSSEITCGVWVGFDKPQKIYRGAFGKDLSLPIWVDTMEASAKQFPPGEFERPEGLQEVAISRITGLPAGSPASIAAAKARGYGVADEASFAYRELATAEQIKTLQERSASPFDKQYEDGEWPRAALAIDLSAIRPVAAMAAPLLGFDDAYQSAKPIAFQLGGELDGTVARALPVDGSEPAAPAAVPAQSASAEIEVRKAEAVRPADYQLDSPAMTLPPPEPIKF